MERRGEGIPAGQRRTAERLRARAFELQKRVALAESTAQLLNEILESNVSTALDKTYEAHALETLILQLLRVLVVDVYACVLDSTKGAASLRSILKDLRKDRTLDALRAYYADIDALNVAIEPANNSFTQQELDGIRRKILAEHAEEQTRSIDERWAAVKSQEAVICSDEAKRIVWARHNLIAHFKRIDDGRMVAFTDDPPYGSEKLTYGEPSRFLELVRPFVYSVFLLVTATSWDSASIDIDRFYAAAFWDRLRNGSTDLQPPSLPGDNAV